MTHDEPEERHEPEEPEAQALEETPTPRRVRRKRSDRHKPVQVEAGQPEPKPESRATRFTNRPQGGGSYRIDDHGRLVRVEEPTQD